MLERDRLIEIGVAVATVFVMIAAMLFVGSAYGGEYGTLSSDGGEVLVVAIVGFIFLLTAVGVALAFVTNEPEDEDADTDVEAGSTA